MTHDEQLAPYFPIAFRIGRGLKGRIEDAAITAGISQNSWMLEAIASMLECGYPHGSKVTAELILHQKISTMVRVPPLILELMNEYCDDRDMPRTIFLLDAMITKLSNGGAA